MSAFTDMHEPERATEHRLREDLAAAHREIADLRRQLAEADQALEEARRPGSVWAKIEALAEEVASTAPAPDPDDDAAWPLPRADLGWRRSSAGPWWVTMTQSPGDMWLNDTGEAMGWIAWERDPDAPAIETVLRAREAARRAKAGTP